MNEIVSEYKMSCVSSRYHIAVNTQYSTLSEAELRLSLGLLKNLTILKD